MVQEESD